MSLPEYTLLAFTSLFLIVDPLAVVPAFLAMTARDTPQTRIRTARLACMVGAGVLIGFVLVGQKLFRLLGITLPAFKIAGSIVLLQIALDMLKARRSEVQETLAETDAGAAKEEVAITPLAVPMLAGPGAMSTAFLLHTQARSQGQSFARDVILIACIAIVFGFGYVIFRLAAYGAQWLSPIALRLTTRIMGLMLAAVAIQFTIDAVGDLIASDAFSRLHPAP